MKIIRKKEGGIDIVFSWKEILTLILKKRTFKFDHDSLKNATLSELAESGQFSPTSIYGASETFSTPLPSGALDKKPNGYDASDSDDADSDGEWTFNTTTLKITHQRNNNSRVGWDYDKGVQSGDNAAVGTLGSRADL